MSLFQSVADNISSGAEWGKRVVQTTTDAVIEIGNIEIDVAGALIDARNSVVKGVASTAYEATKGVAKTALEAGEATIQTGKEVAGATVQTGKEIAGATFQATKDVVRATAHTGNEIGGALGNAILHPTQIDVDDLNRSIDYLEQKADKASAYVNKKAVDTVNYVDRKTDDALDYIDKKADETVAWAIQKKDDAKEWAKEKAYRAANNIYRGAATAIGSAATRYKPVEACLQGAMERFGSISPEKIEKAKKLDGQYMGNDCPNTSSSPPLSGHTPSDGCKGRSKIIYTNGINTPPETACKTMQVIADTLCAEVIGVYNASFGPVQDILDAKSSIDRKGQQESAYSQSRLIIQMLSTKPPQPVTLFAHSEGGLITQEALAEAHKTLTENAIEDFISTGMSEEEAEQKAQLRVTALMSNIDVYSFGTAELNWPPVGIRYHQFTNIADPVPIAIGQVQKNRGNAFETKNLVERHRFEVIPSSFDPFSPHYMDDVYLPQFAKIHPVKKINGKCC